LVPKIKGYPKLMKFGTVTNWTLRCEKVNLFVSFFNAILTKMKKPIETFKSKEL